MGRGEGEGEWVGVRVRVRVGRAWGPSWASAVDASVLRRPTATALAPSVLVAARVCSAPCGPEAHRLCALLTLVPTLTLAVRASIWQT